MGLPFSLQSLSSLLNAPAPDKRCPDRQSYAHTVTVRLLPESCPCIVCLQQKYDAQSGCYGMMTAVFSFSHNHRLSRWLAQPYKGMLLAGLKAHRKICQPQADSSYR